jgi:hypothetical protein
MRYFDYKVEMGDLIAYAGSTGKSSATHVHFALKWCDKNGNGLHTNNGTYGAFDPTPYYENTFVLDHFRNEVKKLESQVKSMWTIFTLLNQVITSLRILIFKTKKSVGSFISSFK